MPNIPLVEEIKDQLLQAMRGSQGHPIDSYLLNIDRTVANWPTLSTVKQARSQLPTQNASILRYTTDTMPLILYSFLAPADIQNAVMPVYLAGDDEHTAHHILVTEAIRYRLVEVLSAKPLN